MTAGPSATNANAFVDAITGAAGGGYLQHHTGDPGAAGTANVAGDTTRPAISFPAASGGSATQTGSATRSGWTGGSQTLTHGTFWSAASGGTFRGSVVYSSPRAVINGDNVTATGLVVSTSPVAA